MSSPEFSSESYPNPEAEERTAYFTDGNHLFEVVEVAQNYGLAGGTFTTLRELKSGITGTVDDLHMLSLEEVKPKETAA